MSQTEPIIIKKYANRRLYNTATSAYIVIADIIKMVEEHQDFVVLDAKTGEDLTRAILNQVIFEQESQASGFMFPLEFQRQLIRMYSDNCKALLPTYLAQSLSYFTDQRDSIGQAMQDAMAQNTNAMVEFSRAMARQNLSYYQHSMDMFKAFTRMGGQETGDTTPSESEPQSQSRPAKGQEKPATSKRANTKPPAKAKTPKGADSDSSDSDSPDSGSPDSGSPEFRAAKHGTEAPARDSEDLADIKAQLLALQKKISDLGA